MKKKLYIFFICLGFLPYILLIGACIYSYFNGSGLVGDTGDLSSAIFVATICILYFWYIYAVAAILIIWSIYKLHQNKEQDMIVNEIQNNNFSKNIGLKKPISGIYIVIILIAVFPTGLGLYILFESSISNYMYKIKYQTGKSSYIVSPENYKLPIDFYNELKERGFLYDSNTSILKNRLNSNHDCINYIHYNGNTLHQKCYERATMIGIDKSIYYDQNTKSNITNMHLDKYPVYLYNSILTLPNKNENMQYAALGRFSSNSDDYGNYSALTNDYYIECKILYTDGDIYAIIGLGESVDVREGLKKVDDTLFNYNYPYNMILSEKENITTYYDGKYYPYGAIENNGSYYEMVPNTNVKYGSYYPIRKVKRLDIDTVNKIAKELQDGILKESIEKHFNINNN